MKQLFYSLLLVLIVTSGCSSSGKEDERKTASLQSPEVESPSGDKIVARVNSNPIYARQTRDRHLNDIIADEIIYDDALRQGFDRDKAVLDRLREYKRDLYVDALVKKDKKLLSRVAGSTSQEDVVGYFRKKNKNDKNESKKFDAQEFVFREGKRLGIDEDKKVQTRFNIFKRNLVLNEYKKKLIPYTPQSGDITKDDIKKYYEDNKTEYTTYDIVYISLDDRQVAEEIHMRAKNGEDLKSLFDEYHMKKPDSKIIFRKAFHNNLYSNVLAGKKIGDVSSVLNEGKDNTIIRVTKIRIAPLSKVAADIRFKLLMKKRDEKFREIARSISQKNNVKVETYLEDQST